MKKKLVSINCSGESIEKVLSLYFYAFNEHSNFYSDYAVELFYSNNLPRKNSPIPVHGTIGFYNYFYSQNPLFPSCSKAFFIKNKPSVLSYLLLNQIITIRNISSYKDDITYWNYISNLPFNIFYSRFINELVEIAKEELSVHKIADLHIKSNLYKLLERDLPHPDIYKIYSLDTNGNIGVNRLQYRDINHKIKTINELSKRQILSGNTALLLNEIADRISPNSIIGYRPHTASKRGTWEIAIADFLEGRKIIIEPKICSFNNLYSDLSEQLTPEEKTNIVYSIAYENFVQKYAHKISSAAYHTNFLNMSLDPVSYML